MGLAQIHRRRTEGWQPASNPGQEDSVGVDQRTPEAVECALELRDVTDTAPVPHGLTAGTSIDTAGPLDHAELDDF